MKIITVNYLTEWKRIEAEKIAKKADEKRKEALEWLSESWVLHPKHSPKRGEGKFVL